MIGLGEIPGTVPSPEEQAAAGQLRAAIVAAVRGLPPKLRDALLLAQAGEDSYEEIAAMLGSRWARSNGGSPRRVER